MSSKDYFSYCNLIVCCGISFAACGRSAEINCIVILSYAIQLLQNPYVTYTDADSNNLDIALLFNLCSIKDKLQTKKLYLDIQYKNCHHLNDKVH